MTGRLNTAPNLQDPDGFYAAYVAAHQGLSDEASELLNARLVLILANHIGDPVRARGGARAGQVIAPDPSSGRNDNPQGRLIMFKPLALGAVGLALLLSGAALATPHPRCGAI